MNASVAAAEEYVRENFRLDSDEIAKGIARLGVNGDDKLELVDLAADLRRERVGRLSVGAIQLAAGPEALEALLQGLPVPRAHLRTDALAAIGQPPSGPDYVLTDPDALRLSLWQPNGAAPDDDAAFAMSGLQLVSVEDFAAVDEASAAPLLGDEENTILAAGGSIAFYGDGGAGKTTLEIDLLMHLAAGTAWLGYPVTRPVRVLVIENEGPRGKFRRKLRAKLAAWQGPPIEDRVLVLEEPWALFSFDLTAHRDALRGAIDRDQIDVIIAGPVQRLGMKGGGTPDEVGAFMLNLELVRAQTDRPVAFVLVHHENKAGDVAGAWEGVPDTLAHVQAQGNGCTRVRWQKVRWASELHGTTWKLLWRDGESYEREDEPARATDDELLAELDTYLADHPGATTTTIVEAVGKRAEKVRSLLKSNAHEDGRYTLEKGPKGANLWSLASEAVPPLWDEQDEQDGKPA